MPFKADRVCNSASDLQLGHSSPCSLSPASSHHPGNGRIFSDGSRTTCAARRRRVRHVGRRPSVRPSVRVPRMTDAFVSRIPIFLTLDPRWDGRDERLSLPRRPPPRGLVSSSWKCWEFAAKRLSNYPSYLFSNMKN